MAKIISLFKEKNSIMFIIIALLFINSGFYLKYIPPLSPVYIFLYIMIVFSLIYIGIKKIIYINIPSAIGIVLIFYILMTQIIASGRPVALLGSITTFGFYILGVIFLPKLSIRQNLFIATAVLLYYPLIYGFDTLYRLTLFKFDIAYLLHGTSFYQMKVKCLLYGDTNPLAISSAVLLFLSTYLYSITKNKLYLVGTIIYSLVTILTFSRSVIIAVILGYGLLFILYLLKLVFVRTTQSNSYVISLKTIFAYIFLLVSSIIGLFVLYKIIGYLFTDSSFATKLNLLSVIKTFFKNANINDILFGIGFNNGRITEFSDIGYAHAYLTTYICETGIVGYLLVTSFLLSIAITTPKSALLIFMFFIMGISYIGHAQLHLFYTALALVWYFEKYYAKTKTKIKN